MSEWSARDKQNNYSRDICLRPPFSGGLVLNSFCLGNFREFIPQNAGGLSFPKRRLDADSGILTEAEQHLRKVCHRLCPMHTEGDLPNK